MINEKRTISQMVAPASQQQLTIGQIRITYLPDGYAFLNPTSVFPTSSTEDWQHYRRLLNDDGLLVGSLGAHLIQTPVPMPGQKGCPQWMDSSVRSSQANFPDHHPHR